MLSDPEQLPDKTDPAKMPGQNFSSLRIRAF
jgi:hypothetical protein